MSTSARIPDYRGPQGIWTQHKRGAHNASSAARAQLMAMPFEDARPTAAHLALADVLTNLHSFVTIVTNHCGDDLYRFETSCPPNSAEFYLRQVSLLEMA